MRIMHGLLVGATLTALPARTLAQCQRQRLLASDMAQSAQLGLNVGWDGGWAVASAQGDAEIAGNSGAVYAFQESGVTWSQVQKLKAADAALGDVLGWSLAISGPVIVAGSPFNDPGGKSSAGAAYVFELSGTAWSQTAKLVASDGQAGDQFGTSVAVSGTRILVGAWAEAHAGPDTGAVYVFERVSGTWTQIAKLTASDGVTNDGFGYAVGLAGNTAMVGAIFKDGAAGSQQGVVYEFQYVNAMWVQMQELRSSDGQAQDRFGLPIAISGNLALVGSTGHFHAGSTNVGGAYVLTNNGTSWTETQEPRPSDGADAFGSAFALSSEHLIIGAGGDTDLGANPGSAFDFRLIGPTWTQVGKLKPVGASNGDVFGYAVAMQGERVFVGAAGDDSACPSNVGCNSGAVYWFDLAPTTAQFGQCASSAPCNNTAPFAGCRNSTGTGAGLAACGSGSVATDDLELHVTHCPPNKLTLLFMAPLQAYVPYGDGIRVVKAGGGVGLYRLGGVLADGQGLVTRGPGIVAQTQSLPPPGRIQAGQSWNFQVWYRDIHGPCHTGTNFTNGVNVEFVK